MSTPNSHDYVTVDIDDEIAIITLQRSAVRNALNRQMMQQLLAAADTVSDRHEVRAVIINAAGDDFSVGADLKELPRSDADDSVLRARRDAELGRKLLTAIRSIHQPTVCALRGIATGGGACIAAACDFRVASKTAQIGLGEVKVGMNLMWNALPLFVELLGLSRAKQLIMSGDLYSSARLEQWGLIDEVCEDEALETVATAWAKRYAALPPIAVQMIKRSVNQYALALGESIMHMDEDQWILASRTEDFAECVAAFAEKRPSKPLGR